MDIVAEQAFDLRGSDRKVWMRLYQPLVEPNGWDWSCRVEVDAPLYSQPKAIGANSHQALELGVKLISLALYNSAAYRQGELGFDGCFGGDLCVPASKVLLDAAPYPF